MNDFSDRTTPVIVSACRTPIGKFLGALAPKTAPELGAIAIREAISRAGIDPQTIDEVIMGQVVQAGSGQAPGRQAAHYAGVPDTVPAVTVNKVCGSGLKAVMLAAQSIRAGDQSCVVAGGQESMSNAPFLLFGAREGLKFGDQTLVDAMVKDGLWCAFESVHMGKHAELTRGDLRDLARGAGRVRVRQPSEGRGRDRGRKVPPRDRAGRHRDAEGHNRRRHGRGPAQGHFDGRARQAQARVHEGGHGDGRERAGPQRRRAARSS